MKKVDSLAGTTGIYYHTDNRQVVCQRNGGAILRRALFKVVSDVS